MARFCQGKKGRREGGREVEVWLEGVAQGIEVKVNGGALAKHTQAQDSVGEVWL